MTLATEFIKFVGNNLTKITVHMFLTYATELFVNAEFYSQHPCFLSAVNEDGKYFMKSINNLLPMFVSFECLDTSLTKADLLKQEAILIVLTINDRYFYAF